MKLSTSWVSEWVKLPSVDSLCEQITMLGLEVDGREAASQPFSGVVVGEVVACTKHPQADKLHLTKVDVGAERLLHIVCGAQNCRLGLKVACAREGALLPNDFKISKTTLRGELSEGMLCSYSELGIDLISDGIIELPQDAPVGEDIRNYLSLDDSIIEISLTPNRADCLSIEGVAREIALVNNTTLQSKPIVAIAPHISERAAVENEAKKACPRYLSRVIMGVDLSKQSPLWLREKLRRVGIRSIDPVVDVTNYVLFELGQPMHAFDKDKVDLPLKIRFAEDKEPLTLLDGTKVLLESDTLVIADRTKALAMAGIFGGLATGISNQTQNIILEAAFFTPLALAGQARKYGLHTDSSHRFERGVDFAQTRRAMEYASALILEICGGQAGEIYEYCAKEELPVQNVVILTREKLDKVLGHSISDEQVSDILNRLGFSPIFAEKSWKVTAPSWRFDIAIEEDLIEEVARVYGYNNIPQQAPVAQLKIGEQKEQNLDSMRVKNALVDRNYQEIISYSFVDPIKQRLIHPEQDALMLPNPLSSQMSAMRLSLITGLLETLAFNQKRQQQRLRFFETGLSFTPCETSELGIKQEMKIAALISGSKSDVHWHKRNQAVDFFDLKGDVELLFALTGADDLRFVAKPFAHLHPGQSAAVILDGVEIGSIGRVHPSVAKAFDLSDSPIIFEVLLSALSKRAITQAQEISKFPAHKRDLALVLDKSIAADELRASIKRNAPASLVDLKLFDIFEGGNLADHEKSLAFSLTFQDLERTLDEDEINQVIAQILQGVYNDFQARLRE